MRANCTKDISLKTEKIVVSPPQKRNYNENIDSFSCTYMKGRRGLIIKDWGQSRGRDKIKVALELIPNLKKNYFFPTEAITTGLSQQGIKLCSLQSFICTPKYLKPEIVRRKGSSVLSKLLCIKVYGRKRQNFKVIP